ncbi:MAG: tetratricopeptide repeat protein, partial [Chloroflexota bacterium]
MLEVKLLGQFDVRQDGASIAIPSRPAQSLLAFLILNAGTAYRREKLAGLLWSDATEENARSYLRHELWRLRKVIRSNASRNHTATYLRVDEISITFDADADYRLDVSALKQVNEQAASTDDLMDALATYTGELLPGFYDDWVVLERERLQATFEQKMARLLDALVEERRWSDVLDWGERWIALGQTPEPAYRALMRAHSALGDLSKVAAVCQRCTESMRAQLGVEPSEQTRALFEQLCKGARPSAASLVSKDNFVRPSTIEQEVRFALSAMPAAPPRSNVPVPLTTFIGREEEIEEIKRHLSTTRLLTLTGMGGVGKTRLATEAARALHSAGHFQDGARWVELGQLTNPAFVPHAVAKVVDACDVSDQSLSETLAGCLVWKQLLLVLDNCEHLVGACAELVENLLRACPDLRILATSREPLGITGETVRRVSPLCLPNFDVAPSLQDLEQCESVRLFVARAGAVKSDFALTEQNAPAVAQICRRLDGNPLAIELAAARLNALSVQEIAAHLDDRFNLLTEGSRTAPPRHQNLRAALDWSYDQLTEPERVLFRRLSILEGKFTLPTTQAVAGTLNAQMLGGAQVFDLLTHLIAKSFVLVDHTSHTGETRYRLLETVREYGRQKFIESGEVDAVFLQWSEADPNPARFRIEASLSKSIASGDKWNIANALRNLGLVAHLQGDYQSARTFLDQSLTVGRELGPAGKYGVGWSLIFLGDAALNQGNVEQAEAYYGESVVMLRELGEKSFLAYSLRRLGISALHRGDYARAAMLCQESLELNVELEERPGVAMCLAAIAAIIAAQGKVVQAARLFGAVQALMETLTAPFPVIDRSEYERNWAAVRAALDEATCATAYVAGRGMTIEQAIAFA